MQVDRKSKRLNSRKDALFTHDERIELNSPFYIDTFNCQLFFGFVSHQVMPAEKRAIAQLNKKENANGCKCMTIGT